LQDCDYITLPRGTCFSERLNAVSRIRVANINWFSNGELAIEKVRVGLNSVTSADCPRLEIEFRWFLEMKHHGASRNLDSAQQLGSVARHQYFLSSHSSRACLLDSRSIPTLRVYDAVSFVYRADLSLHLQRGFFCL
jgi:hypothetical protein